MTTINIKNMVCPRCITAVRAILVSMGFAVEKVALGEAVIENDLTEEQRKLLASRLQEDGFELLDDPRSCLVEQIKVCVLWLPSWIFNR